jgi:ATP-dependent helicase HrpA
MRFRLEDEAGETIAEGEDLDALRAGVAPRLRAALTAATPDLERHGLRDWTVGTLPREIELPGTGVRAFPALVDEGDAVGVRALETPEAQAEAMRAGIRRLLWLTIPSPLRWVADRLDLRAQLALSAAPHGSLRAVLEDALAATLDALVERAGGPPWDEAGFRRLRERIAGVLADQTLATVRAVVAILDLARELDGRLDALTAAPLRPVRDDVARQRRRLVHPGFVSEAGAARLPDVERYLRGALQRLDRLPAAGAADLDRMRTVQELEALHERAREGWGRDRPLPPELREMPWTLEELRVAQFAQGLGTRGVVSAKRVRRALDAAGVPASA